MTPTERVLAALEQHGCDPKQNGNGWSARCPAHDDKRPSLCISEGDDAKALVDCKGPCAPQDVVAAVGLTMRDLFPDASSTASTSTKPRQAGGKQGFRRRRQSNGKPKSKTFDSAEVAIEALESRRGKRSAQWTYHDANGDPVGMIVRWDKDGGKEIRPVACHGDLWIIGGMPEPRFLYRLQDLAGANRVYICEGEKAADAANSIGLTVTTSAHGSQSADKTDWSPLAGKECVILPDNDEAGGKYADSVTAILAKLTPPAVVRVLELPELPDGGDIDDWVEAHDAVEAETLRQRVEDLADQADKFLPERSAADIERFKPFPTDALPKPIRGFVEAGAKAIGCAPSYLALPMLSMLAAAIGNTRQLLLKLGWTVPSIIWTVIVGESGTAKTPAFKLVLRPMRDRQRKALELHAEAMQRYEDDLTLYEKTLSEWKRDKNTDDPPPTKPDLPQAERCIVADTTVEALAPLLRENQRGLLMARDELAGWFGSFDRYAGGKGGADATHWLSMHAGDSIVVDRKSGNPRTIFVPDASMSVTGGIQPSILHRALGTEHRESGLAARLLLSCPPRIPKRWTEADINPDTEAEIARLVDRLFDLQPTVDDDGNPRPVVVGLTRDAKTVWTTYYNAHAKEQTDLTGELSAAWSKLEEYAARLALVIHFVRWAADDPTLKSADVVDAVSMEAGVTLAQWFKAEVRRVYSILSESDESRDQRRLMEWIERKGGSVTARKVQQGCRWLREPGVAEAALNELGEAGCGDWYDVPPNQKGGRPSRVFRLSTVSTSTQPAKTLDSEGFVDVDSVDTPETQDEEEWGEL